MHKPFWRDLFSELFLSVKEVNRSHGIATTK